MARPRDRTTPCGATGTISALRGSGVVSRSLRTPSWLGLLLTPLLAASCAGGSDVWEAPLGHRHPLAGRIWAVRAGAFVTPEALLSRLADFPLVLLGEKHDNPDHHRLQARVVEELVARGRRPALAFEMLSADVAPDLAAALARPDPSADAVRRAVRWDTSGWPAFSLYEPVFAAGLRAGLPLVAADAPRATLHAVARGGLAVLSRPLAERLDLDAPLPEPVRRALQAEIREAHCGHLPEARLDDLVAAQWLRDAHLASAVLGATHEPRSQADGAVLVAGTGHVRRDLGVPRHLERLAPGTRAASLVFLEVPRARSGAARALAGFGAPAPFDWVWFTARVDDQDPCERFRNQLETLRERPGKADR